MCLGIPGQIISRWEGEGGELLAAADFDGELRQIRLNYLPDLEVGEYVIVHAGFAFSRIAPDEAAKTIALMREVGVLAPEPPAPEAMTPGPGPMTISPDV